MPTDEDVDVLGEVCSGNPSPSMDPVEWGDGLAWSEFRRSAAYPHAIA